MAGAAPPGVRSRSTGGIPQPGAAVLRHGSPGFGSGTKVGLAEEALSMVEGRPEPYILVQSIRNRVVEELMSVGSERLTTACGQDRV